MLLKLSRVYCCTPLLQLEHVHVDSFLMHASLPCVYPHGSGHACLPCVHSHGFAKLLKHVSMLCQSSWQSQDYLALIFSRIFSQLLKPLSLTVFSSPGKSLEADVPIKHEKHSRKASEAQVILISSTFRHCCNVTHIFKIGT